MTQDEIIRMAEAAGLAFGSEEYPDIWQTYMYVGRDEIERFAALVAAHAKAEEREACANVCEEEAEEWSGRTEPHEAVVRCAAAIRARSNHG